MKPATLAAGLAALSSVGLLGTAAQAADITIASSGPVIELTVSDTVNVKPDAATVSAGITTRAASANEAARENAKRMDAVIARLRQLGVPLADIQTSNFSLNPQYTYPQDGKPPVFVGYDVNNQVIVKLRDIAKIGPTLDALVAAGANNFAGPNFILENDSAARTAARKNAFASAEARARELAGYAGYQTVKLLELSETYQTVNMGYGGGGGAITVTAMSREKVTPIEPGLVGTAATLTVKYEMAR